MAGEGRDGAAVSLLGYRVGGGRDSHTKLGIKTRWSATVGRRSKKLGFDADGGLTMKKREVSVKCFIVLLALG